MEHYDTIIVGAGIAGAGLAYNLKRDGYKGSVLVIDKEGAGGNAAYGYKNTFKEVIDEYNLSYYHKYKGMRLGALNDNLNHNGEKYISLDKDFYLLDYKETCEKLLGRSETEIRKEVALGIKDKILFTNYSKYKYDHIVDCSGPNFFLKKILRLPLPMRYWVGKVMQIDKQYLKEKIDYQNYFYYIVDEKDYLEDFYPLKDKILWGLWKYTNRISSGDIDSTNTVFRSHFEEDIKPIKQHTVIGPVAPAFPMIYKQYAFLGDSFGHASTSSGEGVRTILDASRMLSKSLMSKNLNLFPRLWKDKYLNVYTKYLAIKMNSSNRKTFLKSLSPHPDLIMKMMRNEDIILPESLKNKISNRSKLNSMTNYLRLRARFKIEERPIRNRLYV